MRLSLFFPKCNMTLLCCMAILLLVSSCKDDSVYDRFTTIKEQRWGYEDTMYHDIRLKDSSGLYDVWLMVRFRKDYEFSNLWLRSRHNMFGTDTMERTEVALFFPDGNPKGKVFGNSSTVQGLWKKNIRLSDSIQIALVQNMRKDPLPGIMDVGVKITPAGSQ